MSSLNTRIIHTHDTEEHWNALTNFVPRAGEFIVFDVDTTHTYERFKIGDGKTPLKDLPFAGGTVDFNFETDGNFVLLDGGRITE